MWGCTAPQWKLVALFLALSLIPLTGLAFYIKGSVRDLQVKTAVSGLMNFVDAKQHGVIRFVGQNEKLATQLAAQVKATGPESVQPQFASIVATDVFSAEDHPFAEEIAAGTRHISTFRTYHAVDFVRDGVITVSSDPARHGLRWNHPVDLRHGYSDVYLVDGKPYLTFGAPARDGMVYVHADALMLTNIVNGEIGNLEGKAGAFYLAGIGETFDYYIVNRDNLMITESRVHPGALLERTGSPVPWQRTLHGAHDPACHDDGTYIPNAGVPTGCQEAMGFYPSADGHEMIGASMPFYDSQWTIVVEQRSDELLAPLTALQNRIYVVLCLIVLAITILAFAVARRIAVKDATSAALEAALVQIRESMAEQERLEVELRHAQKLESVGRLAAGIAHEINTPVQFIGDNVRFLESSFTDLLRLREAHDSVMSAAGESASLEAAMAAARALEADLEVEFVVEEVPDAIKQTLDGVERVATIVRAMKAFGYTSNEEKTPANLNEAIVNTLIVAGSELKYVTDVQTDLGELPPVWCHIGDINQVVLNLVVNAAHAIADAGAERGVIRVSTRVEAAQVVIDVTDTGTGIPPEVADKVFEAFFTTKEVGIGTGQGLAVCRSLVVDRHGGSINFTTEPGAGTTFTVRLPAAPRSEPATAAVHAGRVEATV